jgi:hypothetical protein
MIVQQKPPEEATIFALKKRTADPANSMHTGTSASRAICNVAFIALHVLPRMELSYRWRNHRFFRALSKFIP